VVARAVESRFPFAIYWRAPVGFTYSIFLQIERIYYAAEFMHPTRSRRATC
jgi:hypothetical protein